MPETLVSVSSQAISATVTFAIIFLVSCSPRVSWFLEGVAERKRAARGRRHFDLPVIDRPRHEAPCRTLAKAARQKWQIRDLDGLSGMLASAAAAQYMMPDGVRAYDTVVFAVIDPILEANTPDDLAAVLSAYHAALAHRTDDPALTGLWLRALQTAAWVGRGMLRQYQTADAAVTDFRARMQEIEATVARSGFDPRSSILLAEPWAHAATVLADPSAELAERFALVEALDPMNARIWSEHARLLLPSRFGSPQEIGALIERAVAATCETHGESVLVNIIMAVHDAIEVDRVPGYSDARFLAAIHDLSQEPCGQVDINEVLARIEARGWLKVPEEIMRRYVTEIHASAWIHESQYFALFDRAWHGGAPHVAERVAPEPARSASRLLPTG